MTRSIFVVAAEPSGDQLGAGLISEIRRISSQLSIRGIGGEHMAKEGIQSPIDITPLSILGFVEALKAYPAVRRLVKRSVDLIMKDNPDMVVLIDSWGFMIRVAQRLRRVGYQGRVVKYVAPQVWAMREGRAKTLAMSVDYLLSIHSFDAPYFEQHGLPVTYVGNPVFDIDDRSGNENALRQTLGLEADTPIIALLLGSRLAEIERLATPFAEAIRLIKAARPDVSFISPVSSAIREHVHGLAAQDDRFGPVHWVDEDRKLDVFAASSVALACSGTVTTQLACAGVPSIVAYKLSPLTYFLAKRLFQKDYISIVNIAADTTLMPEFIQDECRGDLLAQAVLAYLYVPEALKKSSQQLLEQTNQMRGDDVRASEKAARALLNLLPTD